MAAKSAYHLEDYETAAKLFSSIDEITNDKQSIYMKGMSYQKLPNPQMEYSYWKENINKLNDTENYQEVLQRLYALEIEFSQYDEAYTLWDQLTATDNEILMSAHLTVLEELGKNEEALNISNKILKKNNTRRDARRRTRFLRR